jgi:hypothetical protein
MPLCVPRPTTGSRAAPFPRTCGRLPSRCPLAGWAPLPPHVPKSVTGSRAATCPRTRGRLPYLHPLVGWAPVPPRVPEPVISFLLSTSLWGGLPYRHMSLGSQLAPVPSRVPSPVFGFLISAPLRGGLPCRHLSLDPRLGSVVNFLLFGPLRGGLPYRHCLRTRDRLPYHHTTVDPCPTSLFSSPCGVGSPAAMCPQIHDWLLYCHQSPGPMVNFLIFVLLWGGLLCHHMSPDPWPTSFSPPFMSGLSCHHVSSNPWLASFSPLRCGVGSHAIVKSSEQREIFLPCRHGG